MTVFVFLDRKTESLCQIGHEDGLLLLFLVQTNLSNVGTAFVGLKCDRYIDGQGWQWLTNNVFGEWYILKVIFSQVQLPVA